MSPSVGSSDEGRKPVGPIEPATKRSVAGRLARDLRRAAVDLERVLAQAPLLELQAGALERVGLDHLCAGFEHGFVDRLDYVGPVEDERLVALALKPAVVLGGEVELLQGRAHPAVEDDDSITGRGYEISFGHSLHSLARLGFHRSRR